MTRNLQPKNSFTVALFEPRIPQNTGNIARTCAAYGITLELIKPLGFSLEDRYLKRAGLDYWKYLNIRIHNNTSEFLNTCNNKRRIIGFSSKGSLYLSDIRFHKNDVLLFGREDSGLPHDLRDMCNQISTIQMHQKANLAGTGGIRSLNLSVACGIAIYSAGLDLSLW